MKSTEPQNGIWNQWLADTYHQSSQKLADFLKGYLKKESHVIDFGCGPAFYLKELAQEGFQCTGVEGFQLNNFMYGNVLIKDLTKPIDLGFRGSVISLEVGEHLPKSAEQLFLDTITNHCDEDLIFSWALPNQPGVGHINCQPQSYIISEVERRGFEYQDWTTATVRDEHIDDNTDWFKRTLLIFKRV